MYLIYFYLTSLGLYHISDNLAPDNLFILSYGDRRHRGKFAHCLDDHPCRMLKPNCTRGHMFDLQFGGSNQCFNCVPQDNAQQLYHSTKQVECANAGGVFRVRITPSTNVCGYSFYYTCYTFSVVSFLSLFDYVYYSLVFFFVCLGLLGLAFALCICGRFVRIR